MSSLKTGFAGSRAPAIYLTPDAVQVNQTRLMDRHSGAGGFLRAMTDACSGQAVDTLRLVHPGKANAAAFEAACRSAGWRGKLVHIDARQPASWGDLGLLYYTAPPPSQIAWQRLRQGAASFAICGVTASISQLEVQARIADYVEAPFAPWDALICTSQSVRTAVLSVWQAKMSYLVERLGASKLTAKMPRTPIIPPGIHTADLRDDPAERAAGRTQWGFDADDVVVLFAGHFGLHARANPLPVYLACARAAQVSGKRLTVLECGALASPAGIASYDEAARLAGVRVLRIDSGQAGVIRRAYAAADMFCSFPDSIQEPPGLTLVEAMAAGLPVVASDWDGGRESVRNGIDGILVPTVMPRDTQCAADLGHAYEDGRVSYDWYMAHANLLAAVDVGAAGNAIATLAMRPELRRMMGEAGRQHVREVHDWKVVFALHQKLWDEQADMRLSELKSRIAKPASVARPARGYLPSQGNPAFLHPLALFAHYPSRALGPESLLYRDQPQSRRLRGKDLESSGWPAAATSRGLKMWQFSPGWVADAKLMTQAVAMLDSDAARAVTLAGWAQRLGVDVATALRMAAFLCKVGAIRVAPPVPGGTPPAAPKAPVLKTPGGRS